MSRDSLTTKFPNLNATTFSVTSPCDRRYNCVAWAAADKEYWWWPHASGYWPSRVSREVTISSFVAAYKSIGYSESTSSEMEDGKEKIAIYVKDGKPRHVARSVRENIWTSKLGADHDIEHELEGIAGDEYGLPMLFLARSTQR